MTREEAILILEEEAEFLYGAPLYGDAPYNKTAFDMAIEALQFVEHFDLLKEYQSLQEVVQCKDCKNWRESHSEDEESYCYIDGRTTDSADYCSWGERKEE